MIRRLLTIARRLRPQGLLWLALAVEPALGAECADMAKVALPDVAVTSAQMIKGGSFAEPQMEGRPVRTHGALPVFCHVQGVASPVGGSRIGFEVWLPQKADWSGRLHMVGNGGFGSNLYYAQLAARVRRGDVGVATDTGHQGGSLTFGRHNRVAIEDWGFRAVHESVVAAKAITQAYYGRPASHNYFSGSSTGGHQALMEAQRYPDDFDGIIAGAPGNNRTALIMSFLWSFLKNHRPGQDGTPIVPVAKLAMVKKAVIAQCDALDGVTDGVVSDPRACPFDPASLRCTAGDRADCLTAEQVGTMQAIYQGPRDARTGRQIYPGYMVGSEGQGDEDSPLPGWAGYWANPAKADEPQRVDFFRYWVHDDPDWNWWTFDWGADVDHVRATMGPLLDAVDPDLARFRARGGKLILFMGWHDPVGAAPETIAYYESVVARSGAATAAARLADTQSFARLYMVPGMGHTAGGEGATNMSNATRNSEPPVDDSLHDMGLALYDWVEKGQAPDALIATKYAQGQGPAGRIAFQRPICVYPKVPRYRGGDTNSAASFTCALP